MQIKYNPISDSRTLTYEPTKEEVKLGRELHKQNVRTVLNKICDYLRERSNRHDWSIDETFDEYYQTVIEAYNSKDPEYFRNTPWYEKHGNLESHHLEEFPHPEKDLLTDLTETIIDSTVRAKEMGVKSKIRELDKDYIYQIFLKTCDKLEELIEVTL